MTTKDYAKIAEVLNRFAPSRALIHAMADMLYQDNGNFNRGTFLFACEVKPREVSAREFDQRVSANAAMIRNMRGDPE